MSRFLRHVDAVLLAAPAGRPLVRAWVAVAWGGAVYGAVMGGFGGRAEQAVYSAVKVPLLLAATTLLALPPFVVLNTLAGLRADLAAAVRAVVGAQGAVAVVLAALAPVTAVWAATTTGYAAAVAFNGVVFAAASWAAQRALRRWYAPLVARDRRHRHLLRLWLGVYGFVGVQMGWVLRPFVGQPDAPPTFLRGGGWGNAYVAVVETVRRAVADISL